MENLKILTKKTLDGIEAGEILQYAKKRMFHVINKIVQDEYDQGTRGKYYIHFWFQSTKDGYIPNYQSRRTRPSPYEMEDQFLWSVEDGGKVTFEWCIPKKEVLSYILSHPNEFDKDYVSMIRRYCEDKLEKIEDYLVNDKVI